MKNCNGKDIETDLDSCVCFNLRKAARAITQIYDDVFRPIELRATQFTVLAHISLFAPITVSRLADLMVMDRTTLTRNLRPLQKRGLLEVTSGNDRRTRVVTLTERGENMLSQALPLWKNVQARIVEGLGTDRWDSILGGLSDVLEQTRAE